MQRVPKRMRKLGNARARNLAKEAVAHEPEDKAWRTSSAAERIEVCRIHWAVQHDFDSEEWIVTLEARENAVLNVIAILVERRYVWQRRRQTRALCRHRALVLLGHSTGDCKQAHTDAKPAS